MFHRAFYIAFALAGVGFLLTSVGHSEFLSLMPTAPTAPKSPSQGEFPLSSDAALTDDAIQRVGRQAYLWGWPLVYVHNCRTQLARLLSAGRCGGMPVAPPNELWMLTDYIAPTVQTVPCPNQDVVYGFSIFDLALEPVVIQVPEFGDRFWHYQLGDQRTDSFADVGKIYGTPPGMYLVVGPSWQGPTPAGIAGVLRCPTRVGFCLPRVFLDDTAADRAAVLPLVNQIAAYPLSRFSGAWKTMQYNKPRWVPKMVGGERSKQVVPERFFDDLAVVLDDVPPLAGEEPFYQQLRTLLSKRNSDSRVKDLLVQTAVAAEREVMTPLFEFRNFGRQLPHYWTTIVNGAAFGTDYLTRAAVAKSNVFVNRDKETKYYYQERDAAGGLLDGARSYRMTFAAGELPPAAGFWSLTLYNEQHTFYANELGRYSLGTKNKELRYNADGSLTILIQNAPPTAGEQANWLPAPGGRFSLYLRAYAPEAAAISGAWVPPPVTAKEPRPAVANFTGR